MRILASLVALTLIASASIPRAAGIDPMAVDLFDILSGGPPVSQINGSGTNWLVLGFQATDNTTGNTDTFYTEFGVPAAGS
jgi:hypothetical protein